MGLTLTDGHLTASDAKLFEFVLGDEGHDNFWNFAGEGYNAQLFGGDDSYENNNYNRNDAIKHPTRGLWFDGRYDFQTLKNVTLPPVVFMYFWINADYQGTLFSTNAVYDERN